MSDPHKTSAPDLKQVARDIFAHALAECSIERAFARKLHFVADSQNPYLIVDGQTTIPLGSMKHVRIIAVGKAAAPMLSSLLSRLPLPPSGDFQGILIAPTQPPNLPATIQFFPGGHPLPNQASLAGATAALTLLRQIEPSAATDTLCIFLISGGASSMLELPLDPAISIGDTAAFHQALVHSGATIVEMNCIRKHFSAVKGGRLALAAAPAHQFTLLVSDVPPAHLDALGSGPTLPDPTTVSQCRAILDKYNLLPAFPASVQQFFRSPTLPETPKPSHIVSPALNLIDSDDLAEQARSHATGLGFHTVIDNTCDDWPCDQAATYLLERIRDLRRHHPKLCLISTGEVTVKLPIALALPSPNRTASGGRNQHLALTIATQLRPEDSPLAVLSAGTDGIDGNSQAAGAVIDSSTLAGDPSPSSPTDPATRNPHRASAIRALAEFDSSTLLDQLGATIVTGPTGHNLRDLRILLATHT